MGRKLVSIQMTHDFVTIPDADRSEMAKLLGGQCVVPKGYCYESCNEGDSDAG